MYYNARLCVGESMPGVAENAGSFPHGTDMFVSPGDARRLQRGGLPKLHCREKICPLF